MANQRTTFDKLQRERAKKAKQAAKRDRRQGKDDDVDATDESDDTPTELLSSSELLARIERVHAQFDANEISFEDFEETKADLFQRLAALPID